MEILLPAARRIKVEKVIIPSPPSWIRIKIIICPTGVKKVAVSWTTSPVTQTPEVAVKRASTKDIWPFLVAKGRRRRAVPAKMVRIKLMAKN